MRILLFITSLLLAPHLYGQEQKNTSSLKLEEIMAGNSFIGHQPENIKWNISSSKIIFDWNPYDQIGNNTYSYTLTNKKIDSLTPVFHNTEPLINRSIINPIEIYSQNGKLFRYNRKKNKTSLIYSGASYIQNVQQSKNSNLVHFQEKMNLFTYNIETGAIDLIASFIKGLEPKDKSNNLNQLEQEESELFEFIRDEYAEKEWIKKKNESRIKEFKKIYLNKSSVSNIQISGNGKFITFRLNDYPESKKTHVENHISKDGHTYTSSARSKVSNQDPNHRLGIYNIDLDTIYFADFSKLNDIRKKPTYLSEYLSENGDINQPYSKDRNIIMHSIKYSLNGVRNIFDIRSYDNKDRWIVSIDLSTGEITEHNKQHDEAWIGGPGISSWNMVEGTLGWLTDNETFYFQSEESGYSHLYTYSTISKEKNQLTKGNWEVHKALLSKKGDRFYITANKVHPGNREFYHLTLSNNKLIPILTEDGNYEVILSPDEKQLAIRFSGKTAPWELYTAPNKANPNLTRVTKSTTEKFNKYKWASPEVITITADDGGKVNARLYTPDSGLKNNAAIIFVHGAGYLQNAHNYWSGYYREYMFHNLLRDNGYTIIDIDYRASKGYGRNHRTSIYRFMGVADLSDQLDGRQYLIDSLGISPDKIGIYGGSYGGFITLMALLTEPGKFACGAAIRSVTDWKHYNHEYTSNILNYPATDPDAYRKSSPIYYAGNLKDRLLILHGMVDDNVQYQDVVRLSQRFIELGVKNWEMASYPIEAHGFVKTSSWIDEYSRILNLFNDELIQLK